MVHFRSLCEVVWIPDMSPTNVVSVFIEEFRRAGPFPLKVRDIDLFPVLMVCRAAVLGEMVVVHFPKFTHQ